jgi:hypothetical protein
VEGLADGERRLARVSALDARWVHHRRCMHPVQHATFLFS